MHMRLKSCQQLLLGVILPLSLLTMACEARAQDPFGLLKGAISGARSGNTPNPKPSQLDATGSQQTGGQAVAGGAVAIVEAAGPGTNLQVMDYVFAGQTIPLGTAGRLTLSHLSGCVVEHFTGGTIVVGTPASQTNGQVQRQGSPGCSTARPVVSAAASEAGAVVSRATTVAGESWAETTINSPAPAFSWPLVHDGAVLRVVDMDRPQPAILWQTVAAGTSATYPVADAPNLRPGMPYRAELLSGDRLLAQALFSFDPEIDLPQTLSNRLVALRPAK